MSTKRSTATNEGQIRDLIHSWTNSIRDKNIDAVMAHYAKDILVFDLAPPLQYAGIDAYRKNFEEWFSSFQGSIGYEITELMINSDGEAAFSRSLNRITGKRTNGEQTDVWVRATVGFGRIDGKWTIVHEHFSVPFYMQPPFKAALDLKP